MHNRANLAERDLVVAREAINADPYDLGHLIQHLLAAAVTGDVDLARHCYANLQRMGTRGAYMKALESAVTRPALLRRGEHAYFLKTHGEHDPTTTVDAAFETVLQVTGTPLPLPLCLVEFVPDSPLSNLAVVASPHFRYIRLSNATGDEKLLSRIARHEVTHAVLSSGNRFLDEGLATFFENQGEADRPAVAVVRNAPNLRAFLSMGGGGGLIFSDVAETDQARQCIYIRARCFVEHLVNTLGWPSMVELMNQARTTAAADLPLLLEQRLGQSLETVETELFGNHRSQLDLIALESDYREARGRRDLMTLDRIAIELEQEAASRGDMEAIVLLAKVRAMQLIFATGTNAATKSACIHRLAETIRQLNNLGLDPVRIALLEGQLSIARLALTSDGALRAQLWQTARRSFSRALEINAQETEAALNLCALLLTTPPQWGGDIDAANRLLDQCRSDHRYATETAYWQRVADSRLQEARS